jgi:hypothetical protein
MFPETGLPDCLYCVCWFIPVASEVAFDQSPTSGKIAVGFWKCPYEMHVIGQYNACDNGKRKAAHSVPKSVTQGFDCLRVRKNRLPLMRYNREEKRSSW